METKGYIDIHSHILWGLDDGAATREDMIAMLTDAYEDGARALCLTSHFEPENFAYDVETMRARFDEAKLYAEENLKGLELYLGNELSIRHDGVECLRQGSCLSLAGGRYVLIDFFGLSEYAQLKRGVENFMCAGYVPIVAHVERYAFMQGKLREIAELSREGVLFQVNSNSLMKSERNSRSRRMAEKLLARGLADFVASDAHDGRVRPPKLSAYRELVIKRYGADYADLLFYTNPRAVLHNKSIQV